MVWVLLVLYVAESVMNYMYTYVSTKWYFKTSCKYAHVYVWL